MLQPDAIRKTMLDFIAGIKRSSVCYIGGSDVLPATAE